MGKNVIRISERRAEPAVYMSALDRLMAGKDFDAAALVEEVEAIERAGQRPPPQFGEKLLAAMHALFIAAAERRGYEQGLIDGYKLAVTDIFRRYEERLEKLIRGFGGAEVLPLAEPLAERRERPRGRPAEDDTPHVGEMVRIIIKDGNTFWDRKAVSKAADQAAEGVPRRHEKKREDVAKTLRYKFEKTLRGLNHLRFADLWLILHACLYRSQRSGGAMAPTSSPSSTRCNMRSTTPFVACWKRARRSAITVKKRINNRQKKN